MKISPALQKIHAVLAAPEEKRADLMEASNRELAMHFRNAANLADLQELAFAITGLAWADALKDDITGRIIESKTVAFDGTDYIDDRVARGLRAYWQGRGGKILSSVLTYTERTQMPRDEMVAALDIHDDEIATDFWGSLTNLQQQYEEKLAQLPVYRLVALIAEALPSGSTFNGNPLSGTFAHATVTEADVDAILRTVRRASNGNVTIMGSRNALDVFGRLGATYTDLAAQIFRSGVGVIASYKGAPLVEVENSTDFLGADLLPDNELWLVGNNAGRITRYGGPNAQVLQLEAFYKRWETKQDAGMLLYGAEAGRLGRIILT